jgi:hypothetical protein
MSKEIVTMASTHAIRQRIAAHPWPRGGVEVIRANRGYTLYSQRTGGQIARLRPTGENDDVRVLWWRGTGWATPGDFGPLIMPLNEALNFVATESFFWISA